MHVRVTTIKRGDKVYRYPQLVQSFRRPDGVPAHKVVASLKKLSDKQVENIRQALKAGRNDKHVVPAEVAEHIKPIVLDSLDFLDIAALMHFWRSWKLDELIDSAALQGDADLPHSLPTLAMVLQRCVAPGSKLKIQRWLPTTVVPELLGETTAKFNNTKLHRVLDVLEEAEDEIQRRLALRYAHKDGAFHALFLDTTDTFFIGNGPDIAEKGKTKEGRYERKVGIALLCNQQGYPLRWEVVHGRKADCNTFLSVFRKLQGVDWAQQTPIVCDRAMGYTKHINAMLETGLRFLTALSAKEFPKYAPNLPHQAFVNSKISMLLNDRDNDLKLLIEAGKSAGMTHVNDTMLVHDLGIVDTALLAEESDRQVTPRTGVYSNAQAMRDGLAIDKMLRDGVARSIVAVAKTMDRSASWTGYRRRLCLLEESVRDDIIEGNAEHILLKNLLSLATLAVEDQLDAYDALKRTSNRKRLSVPTTLGVTFKNSTRVRAIAYFNPEIYLHKRLALAKKIGDIQNLVTNINTKFVEDHADKDIESDVDEVRAFIKKIRFGDTFKVEADGNTLILRTLEGALAERRRILGFSVLVAHPELEHSAQELAILYRAKNMVEVDFGIIKGVLDLRPIHHQTTPKVRAHVTICMLALLLERTLSAALRDVHPNADVPSATRALEIMSTCKLNRIQVSLDSPPIYTVTQPKHDQRIILQHLGLEHLANDQTLASMITPR